MGCEQENRTGRSVHTHLPWNRYIIRTFQEQFLSPRTISFGIQCLIWDCSEANKDEWLGQVSIDYQNSIPKSRFFDEMLQIREQKNLPAHPRFMSQRLEFWNTFVTEYRSRTLTNSGDRIMAFAGTACAAHNLTNLTYFAGLWAEYLPLCLLWKVWRPTDCSLSKIVNREPRPITERGRRIQKVPTWSWFSLPNSDLNLIELDPVELFKHSHKGRGPSFGKSGCATLISADQPSCSDQAEMSGLYHDFEGSQITLSMYMCNASSIISAEFGIKPDVLQEPALCRWPSAFDLYPDLVEDERLNISQIHLGLLCKSQSYSTSGAREEEFRLMGLCLVPGVMSETWQKVGLWVLCFFADALEYTRMQHQRRYRPDDSFVSFKTIFPFIVQDVRTESVTLI